MKKLKVICAAAAVIALLLGTLYSIVSRAFADHTPPVITVEQDTIECSITTPWTAMMDGIRAVDNKDGDITDRVLVNDIKIASQPGSASNQFVISYVVFDSSNNMSSASRTLIYKDYVPIHFSVSNALRFHAFSEANLYLKQYISAEDCIEGDISSQITLDMSNAFLEGTGAGTYQCTATVTNRLGETAQLVLNFDIVNPNTEEESQRPEIKLSAYIDYIHAGSEFDPQQYLATAAIDRTTYRLLSEAEMSRISNPSHFEYGYYTTAEGYFMEKSAVTIRSDVDTSVPGVYSVWYSLKHPAKETEAVVELIIVVENEEDPGL